MNPHDCVARSAILLKPNVASILLFNFCEQKCVWHGPITIAIDCKGNYLRIFEEKWANYAFGPKFAPNSDSFWMQRLYNVCVQVLLVYIPAKVKISFICKNNFFFFAKIGIFWKSISGALSEEKTHRMVNGLQLLNQVDFVWCHTKVIMQNTWISQIKFQQACKFNYFSSWCNFLKGIAPLN